jgi:hypothetical protein
MDRHQWVPSIKYLIAPTYLLNFYVPTTHVLWAYVFKPVIVGY